MLKNMGWCMKMDNKGNFTLEIVVVGIVILLILGITSLASEISQEKISKNVENSNIEKTINEVVDTLINDPGTPINWEDFKPKRIGLAIITPRWMRHILSEKTLDAVWLLNNFKTPHKIMDYNKPSTIPSSAPF